MAYSNNMTRLLNKIELRLGTKMLKLPDDICKDRWADDVIKIDTLVEFSRYFPNKVNYTIDTNTHPQKDGWFLIDESYISNCTIIGLRDMNWQAFTNDSLYYVQDTGYGYIDMVAQQSGFSFEDAVGIQMGADIRSLFSVGIYPEFKAPNMFRLVSVTGANINKNLGRVPLELLITHSDNLTTISPTKMSIFEDLAICDVAGYLYRNLKYFDQKDTVYANIDMKLEEIQDRMNRRDEVIQIIKDSYVSASNENQPIMITK